MEAPASAPAKAPAKKVAPKAGGKKAPAAKPGAKRATSGTRRAKTAAEGDDAAAASPKNGTRAASAKRKADAGDAAEAPVNSRNPQHGSDAAAAAEGDSQPTAAQSVASLKHGAIRLTAARDDLLGDGFSGPLGPLGSALLGAPGRIPAPLPARQQHADPLARDAAALGPSARVDPTGVAAALRRGERPAGLFHSDPAVAAASDAAAGGPLGHDARAAAFAADATLGGLLPQSFSPAPPPPPQQHQQRRIAAAGAAAGGGQLVLGAAGALVADPTTSVTALVAAVAPGAAAGTTTAERALVGAAEARSRDLEHRLAAAERRAAEASAELEAAREALQDALGPKAAMRQATLERDLHRLRAAYNGLAERHQTDGQALEAATAEAERLRRGRRAVEAGEFDRLVARNELLEEQVTGTAAAAARSAFAAAEAQELRLSGVVRRTPPYLGAPPEGPAAGGGGEAPQRPVPGGGPWDRLDPAYVWVRRDAMCSLCLDVIDRAEAAAEDRRRQGKAVAAPAPLQFQQQDEQPQQQPRLLGGAAAAAPDSGGDGLPDPSAFVNAKVNVTVADILGPVGAETPHHRDMLRLEAARVTTAPTAPAVAATAPGWRANPSTVALVDMVAKGRHHTRVYAQPVEQKPATNAASASMPAGGVSGALTAPSLRRGNLPTESGALVAAASRRDASIAAMRLAGAPLEMPVEEALRLNAVHDFGSGSGAGKAPPALGAAGGHSDVLGTSSIRGAPAAGPGRRQAEYSLPDRSCGLIRNEFLPLEFASGRAEVVYHNPVTCHSAAAAPPPPSLAAAAGSPRHPLATAPVVSVAASASPAKRPHAAVSSPPRREPRQLLGYTNTVVP